MGSVEDEVLGNLRAQPIGGGGAEPAHTVADLALPEPFLRRVAGRVIRSSYEEHFRAVVADVAGTPRHPTAPPTKAPRAMGRSIASIRLVDRSRGGVAVRWSSLPEGRPVLRGFRAPLGAADSPSIPVALPQEADAATRRAAAVIASRLAVEGLLATLAHAVDALGPDAIREAGDGGIGALAAAGFPVDLLAMFSLPGAAPGDTAATIRLVAERLASREAPLTLAARLRDSSRFHWTPTVPGFRAASDAGDEPVAMLRLQLTGDAYWGGRGAGGGLDVARQLAAAAPELRLLMSVESRFAEGVMSEMSTWPSMGEGRACLIAEAATVGQWARDNGVVGWTGGAGGSVTLAPRYASRGEAGAVFVPGESAIMEGLKAAGLRVARSPLLFQGGDLVVVPDPGVERRVLLVGEAEVARNTMLGLTAPQVVEALRAEFGVDHVEVLPAASFHVDYEVSARVVGDRVVAFVADTASAARLVLEAGVRALEGRRLLDRSIARAGLAALTAGNRGAVLEAVGPPVYARAIGPGRWPESFAGAFAAGPGDSGIGNLHRFLLALDMLAARTYEPDGAPPGADEHLAAYLAALRQAEADRAIIRDRLASLGWTLVAVPSLGDGARAINPLNAVHTPGRLFMPAYGGLYRPVDDAAAAVYRRAIGAGVRIVPILCGESQRREGALRCSVATYPDAPDPARSEAT